MTGLPKSQEPGASPERCWIGSRLSHVPFDPAWWNKAWNHAARLRKRGISPSAADCLIATISMEHHLVLLHSDHDFEAMKPVLPIQTLDWTGYLASS